VYNMGFIIEQVLGHITHAHNLQATIPQDSDVRAHWGLIPYEVNGLMGRMPVYRSNWTVRVGLRTRRALHTMASQAQLDALFFHTQVPAMLALDWVRRVPSIISLDATPRQYDQLGSFYAHDSGAPWMEQLKWRLSRTVFDAARHLVTWSSWAKQGLVDDYAVSADKITVIPPGVTVSDWLRPKPRTPHEGPAKILFVGGDLERKGGLLLLEAFRALRPLGVELHLVTRDQVQAEPGLFVYHNMRPNSPALRQLYYDCDIFALPTYGDCLPMVLSEAGAAGMAIVSTQLAAIPEVICDGESGILVPVGNVAKLTDALRGLILQPELRLRLGERAVDHVARHYDTRKNAMRLLELLKSQADAARKRARMAA
jgi:glycosyltransferase involved in cell wall biosynthesis